MVLAPPFVKTPGVADNLAGLDRINGGKVHGPVWEGSFLNGVTADCHHLSMPFVDQYNGRMRNRRLSASPSST